MRDREVLLDLDGSLWAWPRRLLLRAWQGLRSNSRPGSERNIVDLYDLGDDLFALSDTHLVTVSLSGGLVKQARELPVWNGSKPVGRGRGTIVGDQIVIPNQRELLVFDAAGQQIARCGIDGTTLKPTPGMVERPVDELWANARAAISGCLQMAGVATARIAGIGLAGHGNGL